MSSWAKAVPVLVAFGTGLLLAVVGASGQDGIPCYDKVEDSCSYLDGYSEQACEAGQIRICDNGWSEQVSCGDAAIESFSPILEDRVCRTYEDAVALACDQNVSGYTQTNCTLWLDPENEEVLMCCYLPDDAQPVDEEVIGSYAIPDSPLEDCDC